jgi:hypothetical protein
MEPTLLLSPNSLQAMLALLLGSKGLGHYWRTHYGDRTFEHLYRWNWIDAHFRIDPSTKTW